MTTLFKIEISGNTQSAGSDAVALERLTWHDYASEAEAVKAVDSLAADWANPDAIWDIVTITN